MKKYLLLFVFCLLATGAMAAQSFGQNNISGTVKDQNGDAVSGASVRLVNAQQLTIKAVEADASGQYRFDDVAAGNYLVTASRSGFSSNNNMLRV